MIRLVILISLLCGMAGAANTYYISSGIGSDSNTSTQAKSKTTPWAHLPGMPSCTSSCASYTPVAGDSFILRGGDSWTNTDLGVVFLWGGSAGNTIYVGVDKTWYTGGAWTRPIFNGNSSVCTNNCVFGMIQSNGNYVVWDNIELTGLYLAASVASVKGIDILGSNTEVKNFYIHHWTNDPSNVGSSPGVLIGANISGGSSAVAGSYFHDNVVDGSDGNYNLDMLGIMNGETIANNVVRWIPFGIGGLSNDIHGNLQEYEQLASDGDHCDGFYHYGLLSGTTLKFYNNIARHNNTACPGGLSMWTMGIIGSPCPSCVSYIYNNLTYDNDDQNMPGIATCGHPAQGNCGTFYVYNNTNEAGAKPCMGSLDDGPVRGTVHFANNHCISTYGSICATGSGVSGAALTCTDDGTNLLRTPTQATSDGYVSSTTYAYYPPSGSGVTVGAGTNETSNCGTFGVAFCSDTTYAVGYDTVNHVVIDPARTVVARPSSAAWDIGVYQYGTGPTGSTLSTGNQFKGSVFN